MPGNNGIIGAATSVKDPGMSQNLQPVVLAHPKKQARLEKEAPKPEPVKEVHESAPAEPAVDEKRAERQAAFKELEKATKLKQDAEKLNASSSNFLKLREAFGNNPTYDNIAALAKEMGQTPDQFLAMTDRIRMGMPLTPNLTPEQIKDKEAKEWQSKMDLKMAETARLQDDLTKQTYMFNRIMPKILDKDKFELLHDEGIEKMSSKIYDFMNAHYNSTKEELPVDEVAQHFEDELFEHAKTMKDRLMKLKKLDLNLSNKKLVELAESMDQEEEPKVLAKNKPNLGDALTKEEKTLIGNVSKVEDDLSKVQKKSRRIIDSDPYSIANNNTVRTKSMFDRNERMRKVKDKFGE